MRVIPDIRKEKLEDAQEILDKAKIKYKDEEEKEFSLKVRRGRVIRTEPEIGEKIKNDQEITIYVSRLWLLPIIILLLIMFLFMFTTIGLSNIKPSNTPKIAKKGDGWVKEELVYVVKDVDLERLDYYEYCISEKKNMKSCEWKATKTKNALVSETGEWYVQFRGVYQDKTKSRKSNKLKVYVDNDAPVVKKVTKETTDSKIHITMSATDKGSGINKYYYKVGDGEWKEADNDFTIKGLDPNKEYNITVKVEDKAGNEYTVEFKATTKDKDNNSQDNSNNNGNNENNNNNDNNANNDNNGDNNPNNPSDNNNGNNNNTNDNDNNNNNENDNNDDGDNNVNDNENEDDNNDENDPGTTPGGEDDQPGDNEDEDGEEELPTIDLADVPVTFEYGSNYSLPSHYSYGTESGEVMCALDYDWTVNYTSTEEIAVGEYTVTCKVINDRGASAITEKQIRITVPNHHEGDEEWDGWIKLNLYYPTRSTNREWRLGRPDEIRDGEEDTGWQPYTGPILVRLREVSNVYIRYDLDGETYVQAPSGILAVDIEPENMRLGSNETTRVQIYFDPNAEDKMYRINGGEWVEYTEPFEVAANTLIEAKANKEEVVRDDSGNVLLTRIIAGNDQVYVGERQTSTPSEASTPAYDFGTVRINIIPEKTILGGNNRTSVEIYYEDDAETKFYKVDNGEWREYTGPFQVGKGQTIYARATATRTITLENGVQRTGLARGNASKTITEKDYYVDVFGRTSIDNSETTPIYVYVQRDIQRVEYKVNDGEWQDANINRPGNHQIMHAGVNTSITVRATYKNSINDYYTVYDSMTVSEDTNSLRVYISTAKKELAARDTTSVSVMTNYSAETIQYKLNNDTEWTNYTSPFNVTKNTLITVKATKRNTDGSIQTTYATKYIDAIRLEVYIDANPSKVVAGRRATVSLSTNFGNTRKYYSLDNEHYVEYTEPFTVGPNDTIYAYAESENPDGTMERAYDVYREELLVLNERLAGPVISENTTRLVEEVNITISTAEEAEEIYYSINGNTYQRYTEPFAITYNCEISAYYIRRSDHKRSQTTYFRVDNIREPQLPYVRLEAHPSTYLSEIVDMVEVSITGVDCDTLEYSFNGTEYTPYTDPLIITQSTTVYARGTNRVGETVERMVITTSTAPIPQETYDVAITVTPDESELEGPTDVVDRATVEIYYDENITRKYYQLDDGELQEYTGPFEITENTVIRAVGFGDRGIGRAEKQINYLTTDIAAPLITVDTEDAIEYVTVTIEYAPTATVKKYRLNDGEWLDYTEPFEVIINETTVEAYNDDQLGHHKESSRQISNIVPNEQFTILEDGMYYLITLNYPPQSRESERQYKWKSDGVWKTYDSHGFALIKPEYRDQISEDGIVIHDNNGNEITLRDHYYILDVPLSEISENIYMRWDLTPPATPTIIENIETWASEVEVAIDYHESEEELAEKLYKVIEDQSVEENDAEISATANQDETEQQDEPQESEWLDYEHLLDIIENNTTVLAKSINSVEISSAIASKKITNIDRDRPVITHVNTDKRGSSQITISVEATDETSSVKTYMYSIDGDTYVSTNEQTHTFNNLNENTEYTIYIKVKDEADNESEVSTITVTTSEIDEITYNLDNEDWDYEKVLTINYPTDVYGEYRKQYIMFDTLDELDNNLNNTEWIDYIGEIHITKNCFVIARIVDGRNIKLASTFTIDKVDPTEPTIDLADINSEIPSDSDAPLPSHYTDGVSGSTRTCTINGTETNYTIAGQIPPGQHTLTCTIITGAGKSATVSKNIKVVAATVKGDSILDILQNSNKINQTGYYNFEVNDADIVYPVHLYVLNEDQVIEGTKIYGDANDVGTATDNAQNMVIVKVKGDYTVNAGATVAPYSSTYGGPKGFMLYVTGKLTNNGTIDNSHGAKAVGQDVYLWKNASTEDYEYVPKVGGTGGAQKSSNSGCCSIAAGNTGGAGSAINKRATGGGGAGAGLNYGTGGAGAAGTSYSGGSGGGAGNNNSVKNAGVANGGAGGAGSGATSANASGGAGNPGGAKFTSGAAGGNGTGGLLIIYANEYENKGKITANGTKGGATSPGGGSSGGGSINIFINNNTVTSQEQSTISEITRYNQILGTAAGTAGSSSASSGAGGAGTVNIGEIRDNQYYDLKEVIVQDKEKYKQSKTIEGESLISILNKEQLEEGYWYFKVKDEMYPVHLYVLNEDQVIEGTKIYGDANDVATSTDNAQNMVIVKVKGDYTVNAGATVAPYSSTYGGPKGFMLYVTGKLTNNGTIDNSHGAKAVGQDVYLWKNASTEDYEYVPKVGGTGGAKKSSDSGCCSIAAGNTGGAGSAINKRATGGGGAGAGNHYGTGGAGAAGTSYSGGSGGGAGNNNSGKVNAGVANGGAGGAGSGATKANASGGAGNPGGAKFTSGAAGGNGTGGLLIIYANEYENKGKITANGTKGGATSPGGGSSGGGSINIFYSIASEHAGTVTAAGGTSSASSGAGGAGTVTYTQIDFSTISTYYTYPSLTINGFKAGYIADNAPQNAITPDDTLQKGSFDGKHETFSTIAASGNAMFTINNDVKDKSLIFDISQMSEDATISFYNKLDQELLTIKAISNKKINIPEGTTKVVINSGSEEMHLNEIDIEEQDLSAPTITTSSTDWAAEKIIKITYPLGYKAEYSTDLGENWQDYTEQGIIINKPTTVIVRVIDNSGKVLSASSMTITKIDDVEPTIELELNDIYEEGKDLAIPTKVEYGLSGGTSECKVNEQVITNIKDLTVGEHTITCTATSKVGKTKTVEKNIRITAKEVEEETTTTTTTTIPVETSSTTTVVTSEVNNE